MENGNIQEAISRIIIDHENVLVTRLPMKFDGKRLLVRLQLELKNKIVIMLHKKIKKLYNKKKIRAFHHVKNKINLFLPERVSTPVFLFGSQRSGTTMLMNVFDLNRNFLVYPESNKEVFDENYRIISFAKIDEIVKLSNYEFTAFKPISDSHLIKIFAENFVNSKILWLYRNYKDVSNSAVKKWSNIERNSISEIGQGILIDDWFTEGLSVNTIDTIKDIYSDEFSLHDCCALWWWARNTIVTENKIFLDNNVLLINYDSLVKKPLKELLSVSSFLRCKSPVNDRKFIHSRSINKQYFPVINERVKELCEQLTIELENCKEQNNKIHEFC